MSSDRNTILGLLLGTALGFALATSGDVLASRRAERTALPLQDAQLMAEVMQRVREEYVDPVDDHELMQHAIRGMVADLDAHSSFLDREELDDLRIASEGNYSGIGVEVAYRDGVVLVVSSLEGSPAARAGLVTGDAIVAIDGQELKAAGLEESIGRIRGAPGTIVRIAIERDGVDEPLEYAIRRERVTVPSVRHALLEPGYGYLRISQFSDATPADVEAAVTELLDESGRPLEALVLDLRSNPGGVLEAGVEVADAFLDSGVIVTATGRTHDARFHMDATPGDITGGARIAVLINGGSASAAEIVAAALRDNLRATLVGRTTFGKGSVQTLLPLSEGRAIKLTTSRYFTPSGASIHERGIDPDIAVAREDRQAAGAASGADPDLQAALGWLHSPAGRVAGQRAGRPR